MYCITRLIRGGGIEKCIELTKPGGKIFIGLYHKYGRKPFLDYFKQLRNIDSDEDFLFEKYRQLDKRHADDKQAKSWFLDQVLHPYESQHTLKEIVAIFEKKNVRLIKTSINQYEDIHSVDELFQMEKSLYDVGVKYLDNKEYYPGFFYVLGQKDKEM